MCLGWNMHDGPKSSRLFRGPQVYLALLGRHIDVEMGKQHQLAIWDRRALGCSGSIFPPRKPESWCGSSTAN